MVKQGTRSALGLGRRLPNSLGDARPTRVPWQELAKVPEALLLTTAAERPQVLCALQTAASFTGDYCVPTPTGGSGGGDGGGGGITTASPTMPIPTSFISCTHRSRNPDRPVAH
jgi:hypothetical protein